MASSSSSSSSSSLMALFFLILFCLGFGLSSAAVLKVGDDVGWTIGKIDYGTWASKKTFHVGDTLLFQYNNSFHNVMEVKKADYDGCNANSPIAKYTTGNDSVAIKSKGDHYFLCGVPGHCTAGQKLKISALAKGSSAAPSTSPAPAPAMAPAMPGGSSGSRSGSASPSEPPVSGSSSPAAAPNLNNAAAAWKRLSLAVFTLAVSAGFMVMFD